MSKNFKRYGAAAILCGALLLTLLPTPVLADATNSVERGDGESFNEELAISQDTVITISGTVTMNAPLTIISGNVTITGVNNGTLLRGESYRDGNMLNIEGGSVTLENIVLDGAMVEAGEPDLTEEHVGISMTGGSLTLGSGTILRRHYVYDLNMEDDPSNESAINACGSAIRQSGGQITMKAGSSIVDNRARNFGNVYVGGSAVFTMEGGEVSGGKLSVKRTVRRGGGGFYVVGTFNMSGGTITGNHASGSNADGVGTNGNYGGGIYCDGGTLNLTGGSIQGNTAVNGADVYILYSPSFTNRGVASVVANDNQYDWTPRQITLRANGGTFAHNAGTMVVNRRFGDVCGTFETPSYANKVFDGWYTEAVGGREVKSYTVVSGDRTIYAHWREKPTVSLAGADVTLEQDSYIYDGTAKTPAVLSVKLEGVELTGADYTVRYADNVDVGEAHAIVIGAGSYIGEISQPYEIKRASIAGAAVLLPSEAYAYTGEEIKPAVTVTFGGKTLTEGKDYDVSYVNNIRIGTATVTVSGIGNYEGTIDRAFTIHTNPISNAAITLEAASYPYTGAEITPTVTVAVGDETLTEGTDYTVAYAGNINAGTATVTVSGKDRYSGEVVKTFAITQKSIAAASIGGVGDRTYTGDPITFVITVTDDNGNPLLEGTDYTVSYSGNTNAGAATVTVTGKGNYTGALDAAFDISQADLGGATVAANDQLWTGSALEPVVTVITADGKTLTEGADYTVAYADNTDEGTATVTVMGKGNYTGVATGTFRINTSGAGTVNISDADVSLASTAFVYTGDPITPAVTVRDENGELQEGLHYLVQYLNHTNAGTATVIVTGTGAAPGTGKVYDGRVVKTFRITPKTITAGMVEAIGEQIYTGGAITPDVSAADGLRTLTRGVDYTVSYADNTNAGTATVHVTGIGNYGGTADKTFRIVPIGLTDGAVGLGSTTYAYTGSRIEPTVFYTDGNGTRMLTAGTDYDLTYLDGGVNAGGATVRIAGKGNYEGEVDKGFEIAPKRIDGASVSAIDPQTYTGSAITPDVTVKDGGKTLEKGTDYILTYIENTAVGTATLTVSGTGNYTGAVSKAFVIGRADIGDDAVALADGPYIHTGSPITPGVTVVVDGRTLTAGTDYDVAYSDNTDIGSATVTVTGKGGYSGTVAKSFTIARLMSDTEVRITNFTTAGGYTYTGGTIVPAVTVEEDGTTLLHDTDYTVSYQVKRADGSWSAVASVGAVGEYRAVISGKGAYAGAFITAPFSVAVRSAPPVRLGYGGSDTVIPSVAKTPEPAAESSSMAERFIDVEERDWYYDAVGYVYGEGIMGGTSPRMFSPELDTIRGMIATILYRIENEPVTADISFGDVAAGQYYTKAVSWAVESGVMNGYGQDRFRPETDITREQLAAMLYRYAELCDHDVSGRADISRFRDADEVSGYALEAMQWSVSEGLFGGSYNTLAPKEQATRAEVAAVFQRYCQNIIPADGTLGK